MQAPPRISGARARACARGGGWGRTAGEIRRRGSRARPRPGPQLPPGPPGSAMIKAILIFNNHGKPRLSKFYQPYVSARRRRSGRGGSRWRPAAPSGRPPQARRGPSGAPAAARSWLSASGWVCRVPTSRRAPFDVAFLRRLLRLSVGWVASRLCGRGPGDFPVRGRSGSGGCSPPERAGFAAHPGLQPAPVSSRGRLLEPVGLAAPPPRLPAFPA